MLVDQPLDIFPIWAVYLLTVGIALLMAEGGYRLGDWWQKRTEEDEGKNAGVVGALVGATLAMLAFLIVFVNSYAADRFDTRRQLVMEDANTIRTLYLRAGYLNEPYRTQTRQLLPEYVDIRLEAVADPSKLSSARTRSEEIQYEIWKGAEAVARADSSDITAMYVESVNDLIDVHERRVTIATSRVPFTIWVAIYFVAFLSMMMVGFNNGLLGSRSLFALVALILIFAAVILLIVDLDRPQEGFLRVSQQPLIDLQRQLRGPLP